MTFLILIGGCRAKGDAGLSNRRAEGREVFSSASSAGGAPAATRLGEGWTIVLESLAGATSAEAQARRAEVVNLLGRPEVRILETKSGQALTLGSFPSFTSADAQATLRQVRAVRGGGGGGAGNNRQPFAGAFLAPPPGTVDPGHIPELNLTSARATFGPSAKYTLQIAVYETPNLNDAKRAAERAALELREEGQLAFYHHGPSRSMVTVGVFSDRDLDSNYKPASPALIQLMTQYPHNLLNGQYPIIERAPTGQTRTQTSMLVRIP